MKFAILSLLLCGLVATGLTSPVHNEQLPPIGGPLAVHPFILNLAKESLVKVQRGLNAAGRVEEALHLNKIIEETERILKKHQIGDVRANEAFDFDDHVSVIYSTLEHYKEFFPNRNTLTIAAETNEDKIQRARAKVAEFIEQLKERKEYAKARVMTVYQRILDTLRYKKDQTDSTLQAILDLITCTIEQMKDRLKERFHTITDSSVNFLSDEDDHMPDTLDEEEEEIDDQEDVVNPIEEGKEKDSMSILENLRNKLSELRDNLRDKKRNLKARVVETYIRVLDSLMNKLRAHKLDETKLNDIIRRVRAVLDRFAESNRKNYWDLLSNEDPDLNIDEEELEKGEQSILDENEQKNVELVLNNLRENLVQSRDRLRSQNRRIRAHFVQRHIIFVDKLLARLKNGKWNKSIFKKIVQKINSVLEKEISDVHWLAQDDEDFEDNLPTEKEEKENRKKLQGIRERLTELRDRLRSQRKGIKVRVVEAYIRIVDHLIERLNGHRLENSRLSEFLKRVKELLEKYNEHNTQNDF